MLTMLHRGTTAASNLLMASDRVSFDALDAWLRGDAFFEAEAEIHRTDGSPFPALFTVTFLPPDGPEGTVLISVVDIAERRQAQHALLHAQAEFARATRAATLRERSVSIAHEVNQPLTAVVTSGETGLRWLRRDLPDLAEVEQSIGRIVGWGRRASQIAAELPALGGDRLRLQQIPVNLMVNASQAMAEQSASRRLRIAARRDGPDRVLITVSDTGPGIAPEDQQRLFEPFFATSEEGMGMGSRSAVPLPRHMAVGLPSRAAWARAARSPYACRRPSWMAVAA
ncbi:hypothetical protein KPL78_25880 [Roseomonas sp. HJA6]|uniref:histidine kinase n=1 Tax=Roseomonas alba TaxID=2846776 RepID=A0ABS7AG77_9PROT|nr:ATP-binding protein [Neoroseomonas alba]MBW6401313.1 hypothetical protein [Neoroseomonas alba]